VLCAVGDLIEDVVVRLHDAIHRDTDTPATIVRRRGGSAANVAYFAAKLTGTSRFVGCVGGDPLGDSLVSRLAHHGVDVCGERHGRTGSIVVIASPDGERTMLTDRGGATNLAHWEAGWLDDVEVLHVPFYSFAQDPLAGSSHDAVRLAKRHGIRISVDLSSVTLIDRLGAASVLGVLRRIEPDVVFATRGELDAVGADDWRALGTRLLVVKDAGRPIRVSGDGIDDGTYPTGEIEHVVDGTGAGDAFAAAFLTSWTAGQPVPACVGAGCDLAGRVVRRAGATLEDE
jgi:sugar/nucleoside kinase (ribokinase family)